jgi:hypothetical protein
MTLGILRACYVSWLWHGCSFTATVPQACSFQMIRSYGNVLCIGLLFVEVGKSIGCLDAQCLDII